MIEKKKLLLGVEAIGQGAVDAGISGVYAYPGTPSTEITEYIQESPLAIERDIHREWSCNEKTAMESALGMSYAGKRALVCMKHVGLNVAADAYVNSAITGVNGGLVVVVADDPSMHSSQNEQDSRFYGKFSMMSTLEPSNQQEAYDMVRFGFELSERTELPVLLRITTRLAHSRAGVSTSAPTDENTLSLPEDPTKFILLPAIALRSYAALLEKQVQLVANSDSDGNNELTLHESKELGVIACGIAYNYLMEHYPDGAPFSILKITQYPLPEKMLMQLEESVDTILVLEEGAPVVEEQLAGYYRKGTPIKGRLDGSLPRTGELNSDHVAKALGLEVKCGNSVPDLVAMRPPALCKGCGHSDMYLALNEVMAEKGNGRVFADIGCYTLGALPPYRSINSCVDMGASITMAKGAADAGLDSAVAVIGDSTFTHSGMTGLLDAVNEGTNITVIIADNESTSMTGGQDSAALGKIETICEGIGVDPEHIRVIDALPKNRKAMSQLVREEIEFDGVSVIIPRRECVQKASRRVREEKAKRAKESN